ncbi:hypothetical protein B0H16DRAFT_1697212 [Mycena metata]|uniref:Uncharacterized protein n=1 Tax=Mycena metata TaxID=1033252 RepID=A0AAD7MRV4_9AGAR|nr:hypothetical protein B0H16DRAFT_1697212 [Mycena metata]
MSSQFAIRRQDLAAATASFEVLFLAMPSDLSGPRIFGLIDRKCQLYRRQIIDLPLVALNEQKSQIPRLAQLLAYHRVQSGPTGIHSYRMYSGKGKEGREVEERVAAECKRAQRAESESGASRHSQPGGLDLTQRGGAGVVMYAEGRNKEGDGEARGGKSGSQVKEEPWVKSQDTSYLVQSHKKKQRKKITWMTTSNGQSRENRRPAPRPVADNGRKKSGTEADLPKSTPLTPEECRWTKPADKFMISPSAKRDILEPTGSTATQIIEHPS